MTLPGFASLLFRFPGMFVFVFAPLCLSAFVCVLRNGSQ